MKKNISNGEVENLSNAPSYTFPKYTTQIINLVNGNAQGTRPDVVGQMSDLIQEFDGKSIEEWINGTRKECQMQSIMPPKRFIICSFK